MPISRVFSAPQKSFIRSVLCLSPNTRDRRPACIKPSLQPVWCKPATASVHPTCCCPVFTWDRSSSTTIFNAGKLISYPFHDTIDMVYSNSYIITAHKVTPLLSRPKTGGSCGREQIYKRKFLATANWISQAQPQPWPDAHQPVRPSCWILCLGLQRSLQSMILGGTKSRFCQCTYQSPLLPFTCGHLLHPSQLNMSQHS